MVDKYVIFDIYVSLAHIRVKDEVTPEFMLYFINSPKVIINYSKSKKEQSKIVIKLKELQS